MRAHYRNTVQDTAGNVIAGAAIAVYQPGTTTPVAATLYADGSSGTTLANPFTTIDGSVSFYLASPQRVDLGVQPPTGGQIIFHDMDVVAPSIDSLDWLNVAFSYGADPTGVTDSTTAIQNALNAVPATGGTVYLPAGTYKISSALTVKIGTVIQGAGSNTTIIKQTSTTAHGIYSSDNFRYAGIRDLQVLGPGSGTGDGIHLDKATSGPADIHLDNVLVKSFGGHGVYVNTAIVSTFLCVRSQTNGGDGFHTVGGTSMSFIGCYGNGNTGKGYYLTSAPSYCSFTGCAADGNAIGYQVDSGHCVAFLGTGAETTIGNSFVINGGTSCSLTSCTVSNNAAIAFWITGSSIHATLTSCLENSVTGSPTASLQVDAGCTVGVVGFGSATSKVLAANTTSQMSQTDFYSASTATSTFTADRTSSASAFSSFTLATAGGTKWSLQTRNDSTDDLHLRDVADGLELLYGQKRATQLNMGLLGQPASSNFGGGVGVIFIANDTTDPTTPNPAGGGLLYVSGGALKYKGSSGTVTTLGAA